jgi:hypothetical protein
MSIQPIFRFGSKTTSHNRARGYDVDSYILYIDLHHVFLGIQSKVLSILPVIHNIATDISLIKNYSQQPIQICDTDGTTDLKRRSARSCTFS